MAAPLTGLGRRPRDPEPHVCAVCGPSWNASRGFPGDVWYCAEHVPPHLRSPWEPGYAPDADEAARAVPTAPVAAAPAPDLFGPVPA